MSSPFSHLCVQNTLPAYTGGYVVWLRSFNPPTAFRDNTLTRYNNSVGKAVVDSLRHPEESFGKALKVQSFVVAPKEVLTEYEKQTGTTWNVSYTSLQQLRELETAQWNKGDPRAVGATLRRIWAEGGTLYPKNDNELIDFKPESLETAVKRAISGSKDQYRSRV